MRKLLSCGVAIATVVGLVAPVVLQAAPAQAANSPTTVVLSFDDGVANQSLVPPILEAKGMRGTFFVNTNTIGTGGFLTYAQLATFQAAGHEIGGHTLDHLDLTAIPLASAELQVCQDRAALMSHGLNATSFAYPYGVGYDTPAVKAIAQACGYNSARRAWGLYSSDPACGNTGCSYPYADTVPPTDPFAVRAGDNPQTATTVAQMETLVTQAQTNGGGLVPIVFHEICNACDPYSTTQANFQLFINWLATSGATVKTMNQVVGGVVQPSDVTPPVSTITCNALACSGFYSPATPIAISATDVGWGVNSIHYTTDGTDPTVASPLYSAPFTLPATATVKYKAFDNAGNAEVTKSQLVSIDATPPVTSIACNAAACSSNPYAAPVSVSLSATDAPGGSGLSSIRYTTDGLDPTVASTAYTTPLSLSSTTNLKYRAFDNAGNVEATKTQLVNVDSTAPVSSIACNGGPCAGGWYNGPVQVSLAASDIGGAGVAGIRYTLDGSDPTPSSTLYGAPFTVSSATTVKFRATDNVGNVEPTNTQGIQQDSIAPVSSIACNGVSCGGGWYNHAVNVSLGAADSGGSGVASIHYTTDGSDPTLASPAYGAPFALASSSTVKYRAFDTAGNVEATNSMSVTIDTAAPTSAILCKGAPCSTRWSATAFKVAFTAKDTGGSGVASIHYTTNGTTPTLASPLYTTPVLLSTAKTVKYRAFDNAGNAGTVESQLVRIDTGKPTGAIVMPASFGAASVGIKITANMKDSVSGVARVDFYVNGVHKASDTTPAFSFVWSPKKAGRYTIMAVAVDRAGNRISKVITLTLH